MDKKEILLNSKKLNSKEYRVIINDYFTRIELIDNKGNKQMYHLVNLKK
jgi:hypothetical protein